MNDQRSPELPTWDSDEITPPAEEPQRPETKDRSRRRTAGAVVVGGLLVGGAAGAALFGPLTTSAASPSASPNTPATTGTKGADQGQGHGMGHGGGFGGHNEAVSDASVVAKAIGISEADLTTALQGGQTVAQVAKAHNVEVQKVIDALVADGMDELAAAVKAGTITQAQADAQKAQVTQRATDQVNGTLMGGHGMGHGGGFGGPGRQGATPSPTPTP